MIPVACVQRILNLKRNKMMLTYELRVLVHPHQTTEPFDNKEINVHWFFNFYCERDFLTYIRPVATML